MGELKISFVILTWNSERYVEKCVSSVLALGDVCLEVLIVDNGSTDDTVDILRRLALVDDRLSVKRLDGNRGTTVSRNMALREISDRSTHICVLDSDTVVNRAAFESMLDALSSHPEVGVIGPEMSSTSGEVQLSGRNLPSLGLKLRKAWPFGDVAKHAAEEERPFSPVVDGLQDVGYLLSACWLLPVSSIQKVGLLDEAIFYAPEDVDWCLRCHEAGLRVCFCPEARITHEYQRLSHKKLISRTNLEHLKGLGHYFHKHGYLFRAPKVIEVDGSAAICGEEARKRFR